MFAREGYDAGGRGIIDSLADIDDSRNMRLLGQLDSLAAGQHVQPADVSTRFDLQR